MKNNKFDFFDSPHPRHLNLSNIIDSHYHHSDDHDILGEKIFTTPIRHSINIFSSPPLSIEPYIANTHKRQHRRNSRDSLEECSAQIDNQQEYEGGYAGITDKLEFSDEEKQDLLIPLTPQKPQMIEEGLHENQTTVRKKPYAQSTPVSESKIYERGLKKLAYQAFKFVSHQKKTTYKEVARKLINQLNDEPEYDVQPSGEIGSKKGQMNIKRRVYDALNVLIALGLLKRNGNKILGKKMDFDSPFYEKVDIQKQKKKEEQLYEQQQNLRRDQQKRAESIKTKERIVHEMKQKISGLRKLEERNRKKQDLRTPFYEQRIQFPFVMLDFEPKQYLFKQENDRGLNFQNWEEKKTLVCTYSNNFKLNALGDFDTVNSLTITNPEAPTEGIISHKIERSRRNRTR